MRVRVGATFVYATNNKLKFAVRARPRERKWWWLVPSWNVTSLDPKWFNATLKTGNNNAWSIMISLRRIISLAESRKGPHWDGYYEMISQTVKGSLFICQFSHFYCPLTIRRCFWNLYCDLNDIFTKGSKPIKPSKTKCIFIYIGSSTLKKYKQNKNLTTPYHVFLIVPS